MASNFLNAGPTWDATLAGVTKILKILGVPAAGETIAKDIDTILAWPSVTPPHATCGSFNPPADLVKLKPVEVIMSVLQLEVGQTAVATMTFDEPAPPADGAIVSDTPSVATISLGSDLETWTLVAVSVGTATMTYTGTSAPPDVGPAVVAPMVVTVVAVPVAEQGDFNPGGAVITGP